VNDEKGFAAKAHALLAGPRPGKNIFPKRGAVNKKPSSYLSRESSTPRSAEEAERISFLDTREHPTFMANSSHAA